VLNFNFNVINTDKHRKKIETKCAIIVGVHNQQSKQQAPRMTSLNFEQWHEWTTQMQNEHSKLNNTECCVCYSYQVLNKNVCGECKSYVCNECSDKLQHNECPICRTSGIVKGKPIESRERVTTHRAPRRMERRRGWFDDVMYISRDLYNDYMEFERNYRANHTQNPQQRVPVSQNRSPYASDDIWLGSQGYTPTGGWTAYYHASSVMQNSPANMVAMSSLTQMRNNITNHY